MRNQNDVDVLIIGAGLAGLSLARHLLVATDLRVLLVDRRPQPPTKQKVGEATVQLSAYYYARVLDMEEHLLTEHFLKYNLRFYWPSAAGAESYEDLSQSYIRGLSNIATYQLDRNKFEEGLLKVNLENPRFELAAPVEGLDVELTEGEEPHGFRFRKADGEEISGRAGWVVDASGRGRFLAKRLGLARPSPIQHGASFAWVEGCVDAERLSDLSPGEIRKRPDRAALGHLPIFLATNHFCGEGYWFWAIPLHGKTSLGLVYESGAPRIDRKEVSTAQGLIDWVCRELPLFARDLPQRKVVGHSAFNSYAHDCSQAFSASRWALTGEAGRFSDPLYSPGGDLISIHNTLIVDAIRTKDQGELEGKLRLYEVLARSAYEAYVPGFELGYTMLGDQECFSLRYAWELTIYFSFYVFPFINDLFTDPSFLPGHLRRFSKLGPWNRQLVAFVARYDRWKREVSPTSAAPPVFFDFMELEALREAEKCFYRVGVGSEEGRRVLDEQLRNLEEMARRIAAHVCAGVVEDPDLVDNAAFVEGFDLNDLRFDPEEIRARWERCAADPRRYAWKLAAPAPDRFHALAPMAPMAEMASAERVAGG